MEHPTITRIGPTILIVLTVVTTVIIRGTRMNLFNDSLTVSKDELGECVRIDVSLKVFPIDVILQTSYWYTDKYFLFVGMEPNLNLAFVEFRNKTEVSVTCLEQAVKNFCNDLIDQSVRKYIKSETKDIETIIIKKAFSEALTKNEESLVANLS